MNRRNFLASGAAALSGALTASPAAAARSVNYAKTGAEIIPGSAGADGFAFPAEWVRHERTLMQFPPPQNWYPNQLNAARKEWAEAANTVAEYEPVTMAVRRRDMATAKKLLSSEISLIEMPLNDAWSRDSGPMIVQNAQGARRIAGFTFNGWGRKFPPYKHDTLAKGRFAAHLGLPMYTSDLVLEGGAVAVDGQGTLLTTEECLLHKNRNPGWSKAQVEAELKAGLGVQKVIWLPRGLTPDPITDGHVDGIAAFAAPGVVLLHTTDDRSDPNYEITQDAKRILQQETDVHGRRFKIIEIPLTSYDVVHMNFYICNGAVVVPVSGRKGEDDQPLAILREAFPGRRVVGVSGRMIGGGGGGVHCITQQVPAV
ncbi:agmatine deiminase family protein [Leisingera sp. HS039]|uniref:agmatine deiminase family protein n=1 Tax=unclassified Leisingera TaxID=2614906 RepID=UPI001070D310|nr:MULTISPECIES: agmatine deiminase family protein [unclassified Leisingera]MBQ4825520.1 agmatine deiminase family protein [Leisingera sp. HS039]QBR37658.1 agmatine deiminase family protein [Leisingera sp. NJS201]